MTMLINGQEARVEAAITEKVYYCTPTAQGLGNGLSWESACTFREAVAKLDGTTTTIYLSGGDHDCDNGSDATGTTISTGSVHVSGPLPSSANPAARLINSAGSATHVLRITGVGLMISDLSFGNYDQTDPNVIMLNIRSSAVEVANCAFTSSGGDGGGTGILIENNALGTFVYNCNFFGVLDAAIEFGATTDAILKYNKFYSGGKGLYLSSASADRITVEDCQFLQLTTAVDYAAAVGKSLFLVRCYFGDCTTNISSVAAWGDGLWLESITESGKHRSVYPLFANGLANAGIAIAGHATAFNWGNIVQIIPTATINYPIMLQSINATNWTDPGVYQIELFYGDTSGTVSLGVYELVLGSTTAPQRASTPVNVNVAIPARSYVGAKLAGSTAGPDTVYISLGYELL